MSGLRFFMLLAVLCSSSHGINVTPQDPVIIDVPKTNTTTEVPPTTSSTTPPTTTPPTTTSTTTPTTTTSTTTPPTTTSTTTPPTTTSTTTPPTTTSTTTSTTTPAPTPTPTPPTPVPNPVKGQWFYTDKTNVTCIVVEFAAQINVSYLKMVEKNSVQTHVLINIPANATVSDGSCAFPDQWLTVSWPANTTDNNMTLVFHRNETTKDYVLKDLNVSLNANNFVNPPTSDPIELYHGAEWQTPLATSYRCKAATLLNMTSDSVSVTGVFTVSSLQEEAYRTTQNKDFSAARECGGSDVPDAVPIAVGCALGGLVLVVLVAYLVGRRRSAARGYLSM